MNWITAPQLPETTSNYLASVRIPFRDGQYVFTDLVHFDKETGRWYKYDPFHSEQTPTEDISHFVVGWIADNTAFFG
jgi:hypothetical protein